MRKAAPGGSLRTQALSHVTSNRQLQVNKPGMSFDQVASTTDILAAWSNQNDKELNLKNF